MLILKNYYHIHLKLWDRRKEKINFQTAVSNY